MAKKPTVAVEEVAEVEETVEEVAEVAEPLEVNPEKTVVYRDSVTVVYRAGSREYTKAVHGEDFVALAEEFAAKKKGQLV